MWETKGWATSRIKRALSKPSHLGHQALTVVPWMGTALALAALALPSVAQAGNAAMLSALKAQVRAMQEHIAQIEKADREEHARIRAELKAQRQAFEADPFRMAQQPQSVVYRSRGGLGAYPGALLSSPAVSGGAGPYGDRPHLVDPFARQPLAPRPTPRTPYADITAMPSSHSDLFGPLHRGQIQIGDIRLTLGGYFEGAGVWRSRMDGSDMTTAFQATPWGNQTAYHMNEWRQSARGSRISLLAEGMITPQIAADGYMELDFQSSGTSSNGRQTNSYNPRIRVLYGEVKAADNNWYFLGGQEWSLLTPSGPGLLARDAQIPLTIDNEFLPGFTWTRTPQFRAVKSFGKDEAWSVGLSLEDPDAIAGGVADLNGRTITTGVPGTSTNNSMASYSAAPAPDTVLKVATNTAWGNFALGGIMRWFKTRASKVGHGSNHLAVAGGGQATAVMPIVKDRLIFRAAVLGGTGLGRYGSAGLPDYTFSQNGSPVPLPEGSVMVGVFGHALPRLQYYIYGGAEEVLGRRAFNAGGQAYGYGNRAYNMSGCHIELSKNCAAATNVRLSAEATGGLWYTALEGDYGRVLMGAQYAHTYMEAFKGQGGKPHTDDNMVFMSVRYMPFN
ncbi:hypothetical protein E3E12_07395 [Formicincola oecophyllae]|uniref:Uncharacterized protein n=1 Tax=Formicincola oecophyllae TaxID=2558361 RepID=A0A4Y6UCB4_9PROT|nr:hypothetical protein [Formicincola oecophyllae]QDH14031.1 hypothetical protein E3E12_07395 [Formicincola oecophyllae]